VKLFLLLAAAPLLAQEPLVSLGFDHFYNLEYDQAIAVFGRAVTAHPNSPAPHNHLAESILFREMFRNGALESDLISGNNSFLRRPKMNLSPETEHRFLDEVGRAMALSEARLKKAPNDSGALYALGNSYALRSNYYWVAKKSWTEALRDATAARRLHNRLSELEPSNVDARMIQGLHDYIVGSLPWSWRALGFLMGIRGDKLTGIRTLQDVARRGRFNRVAAEIILCALYRRENRPQDGVPLVTDLIEQFPRNFLLRLELSQMYSLAGDREHALGALNEAAALKQGDAPGFDRLPWEKIWFQEAAIQFRYHDLDHALENLRKVTARPEETDQRTWSAAWLRIGQIYDIRGRRTEAMEAYRRAIANAPQAEAAQESRRYLANPYRRM
jgi:tetratricopeptide (TPR) repeat protein